jgi:hypothetical protein
VFAMVGVCAMVEGWREEGEVGGWECECERELREEGGRDKGSWIMVLSGGDCVLS